MPRSREFSQALCVRRQWGGRAGYRNGTLILAAVLTALCIKTTKAQNLEILGEYSLGVLGEGPRDFTDTAVYAGAFDAAEALSLKYTIRLNIVSLTPLAGTIAESEANLRSLLTETPFDGLAVSPPSEKPEWFARTLRALSEKGTQLTTFQRQLSAPTEHISFPADNHAAGYLAANETLKRLPRRGTIAILAGNHSEDAVLAARLEGAVAALGRAPHTVISCAPDFNSALEAVREAHRADRDRRIRGWIFLDDWPLRGQGDLPWQGRDLTAVAIEASPASLPYLRNGQLAGVVMQPAYAWGYASVVELVYALHDRTGEAPARPEMVPVFFSRAELPDIEAKWRDWQRLRSGPLDPLQ